MATGIIYKTNQAKKDDILNHLKICSKYYIPPLHHRVDIDDYAQKIYEKADTFEAWNEHELVGLVATYCNDFRERQAFITNVSVVEKFSNRGIASELLSMCIKYMKKLQFREIILRVNQQNEKAISLYRKHDFQKVIIDNDFALMRYQMQ